LVILEEKFTLIHTFPDSSKIHIYRLILEEHNIPYFIKDELTNQVLSESSFIGGAKLLVDTEYIGWVITLLETEGLALDYTEVKEPSFIERFVFEKFVSRLPTDEFGTPKTLFQVLKYPLLIIAVFIGVVVYIQTDPKSELEELLITLSNEGSLCVYQIEHNNEVLDVSSNDTYISLGCREKVHFLDDGSVILPGLNTKKAHGTWEIDEDNHLNIETEDLKNIYSGIYAINKSGKMVRFASDSTTIFMEFSRNFSLNSF